MYFFTGASQMPKVLGEIIFLLKVKELWDVKRFIQDNTIREWQDPKLSLLSTEDYVLNHWGFTLWRVEYNHSRAAY